MHVETGDNFGSHSPGTIHLVFGDSVFYQLGASQFIWAAWPVMSKDLPVPISIVPGLQVHATMSRFFF